MDRGYLVGATSPTVLYRFFQNITGVQVMVWRYACGLDIILRFFCHFFCKLNLAIFLTLSITKLMDVWYLGAQLLLQLIPILSKLHCFFGHGLKICMWLRYNPKIIFVTFLQVELSHISSIYYIIKWMNRGYLVGAAPPTVLCWFFWNFTGVLVMVWKHACGLDINLRLFLSLFSQVELSHFSGIIYNKVDGHGIPCGRNSSYSFIRVLLKLHWCFGYGLKICMWLGYNQIKPQLNIYHFSSIFSLQCYQYPINVYIYVVPLSANAPTILYNSLWNICVCLCHGLKIWICFGYNS